MKVTSALVLVSFLLWPAGSLAGPNDFDSAHASNTVEGSGNGHGYPRVGVNGKAEGAGNNNPISPAPGVPASTEQNAALKEVGTGAALRLNVIVDIAQEQWAGRVIDAKLIGGHGHAFYQLTMLTDDGVSRHVYYDARSGHLAKGM